MPRINIKTARVEELRDDTGKLEHVVGAEIPTDSSNTYREKGSKELRPLKKLKVISARINTLIPIPDVVSNKPFSLDTLQNSSQSGNLKEITGSELVAIEARNSEEDPLVEPSLGVLGAALTSFRSKDIEAEIKKLVSLSVDDQLDHASKYSFQCSAAMACVHANLCKQYSTVSNLLNEVKNLKNEVEIASKSKLVAKEMAKKAELRCAELDANVKMVELEKKSLESELMELKAERVKEVEAHAKVVSELDAARRGEGLDLNVLANSEIFKITRDNIEQSFGYDMLRMIREEHPGLEFSFEFD